MSKEQLCEDASVLHRGPCLLCALRVLQVELPNLFSRENDLVSSQGDASFLAITWLKE